VSAATTGLVDALDVLGKTTSPSRAQVVAARDRLIAALEADASLSNVWLTMAVLTKGLPTETEVRAAHRTLMTDSARALLRRLDRYRPTASARTVELARDVVIVDVRHTSETDLATGIQRVARETVKRWVRDHDVLLVTWTLDGRALRRLLPEEHETAIHAAAPLLGSTRAADQRVVVPVGGTYILPELAAEVWRTERVAAMGEFAGLTMGVIGFDCVPLTTAETVGDGMPGAFARNLVAVAKMDRLAAISDAAAEEYSGWKRMLPGSGVPGPEVTSILLAAEAGSSDENDAREFEAMLGAGSGPLVLIVGSHEPRKNHLAVLQAAEMAWRQGIEFRLVFVGGNSWNSLDFTDLVIRLKGDGRQIEAVSALPDRLLWAAYRLARFTIFASINEGFGLPVAESLASGTPVITSDYGSMKQIAAKGGAITVDPRNDSDIADAIVAMLTDETRYTRLRAEAAGYRVRPWDDYARDVWHYFTVI
jgi:glycosyltransferase involved in cell wall biosynthesis